VQMVHRWVLPVLRWIVLAPSQVLTLGTHCGTWSCMGPASVYPGVLPRVMRP
jgi:hypothetical protein